MQLMLLVDGAIAAALVRGEPRMARTAREAARVLLAAAGVDVGGDRSDRGRPRPHLPGAKRRANQDVRVDARGPKKASAC